MKRIKLTDEIVTRIKKIISSNDSGDFNFVSYHGGYKKCLIYPTDDLYLFEEQFIALDKAMREKKYYVMQFEELDQIFRLGNCIFEFSCYEDYKRIYDEYEENMTEFERKGCSEFNVYHFWSKTILFSDSFDWVLQINEARDGGIGLLGGTPKKIDKFIELYGRCYDDLSNCEKYLKECGWDINSISPNLVEINNNLLG